MAELKDKIRERVFKASEKIDRNELVEDLFKSTVAGMLEVNIGQNKNRIEAGFLQQLKAFVINTFRSADLEVYQRSVKQYEDLFQKTLKEILNSVGHHVEDISNKGGRMSLDPRAYGSKRVRGSKVTPGGIILPPGY